MINKMKLISDLAKCKWNSFKKLPNWRKRMK